MKKICVVTGTRAEYGLLKWVMEGIYQTLHLELQIIVTGMHLSPEFGMTVDIIEQDGFKIDHKVEMLLSSDTSAGITKSMGLGFIGFADALVQSKPDLVLILGDRYEIFAAAVSALIARVPIAHIHGGEKTEGAFDEAIRHSITKMSYLHFVATDDYRRRVIQLGEEPDRVFQVGGLGVDNILRLKFLDRSELEAELNFKFLKYNLLITFHPVTLEKGTTKKQINDLLTALAELDDTGLIFTMPNADTDSRTLVSQIELFCSQNLHARAFTSLGQKLYLSCVSHVDGVVGNSSSGLLEVPSLKKGTINIGDRQRGRIKAKSVIDCEADYNSIRSALRQLFSIEFQEQLSKVENPYGNGNASNKILKVLQKPNLNLTLKKRFYDLTN